MADAFDTWQPSGDAFDQWKSAAPANAPASSTLAELGKAVVRMPFKAAGSIVGLPTAVVNTGLDAAESLGLMKRDEQLRQTVNTPRDALKWMGGEAPVDNPQIEQSPIGMNQQWAAENPNAAMSTRIGESLGSFGLEMLGGGVLGRATGLVSKANALASSGRTLASGAVHSAPLTAIVGANTLDRGAEQYAMNHPDADPLAARAAATPRALLDAGVMATFGAMGSGGVMGGLVNKTPVLGNVLRDTMTGGAGNMARGITKTAISDAPVMLGQQLAGGYLDKATGVTGEHADPMAETFNTESVLNALVPGAVFGAHGQYKRNQALDHFTKMAMPTARVPMIGEDGQPITDANGTVRTRPVTEGERMQAIQGIQRLQKQAGWDEASRKEFFTKGIGDIIGRPTPEFVGPPPTPATDAHAQAVAAGNPLTAAVLKPEANAEQALVETAAVPAPQPTPFGNEQPAPVSADMYQRAGRIQTQSDNLAQGPREDMPITAGLGVSKILDGIPAAERTLPSLWDTMSARLQRLAENPAEAQPGEYQRIQKIMRDAIQQQATETPTDIQQAGVSLKPKSKPPAPTLLQLQGLKPSVIHEMFPDWSRENGLLPPEQPSKFVQESAAEPVASTELTTKPIISSEAAPDVTQRVEPVVAPEPTLGDELSQHIDESKRQFVLDSAAEFKKNNAVKVEDGTNTFIVTKSANNDGYQVTTISNGPNLKGEPLGHSEHPTLKAALEELSNTVSPDRFRRADLPIDAMLDILPDKAEYVYEYKYRPMSIGTQPEGFTRGEEGGKHGRVVYDRPLRKSEMDAFELSPVEYRDLSKSTTPGVTSDAAPVINNEYRTFEVVDGKGDTHRIEARDEAHAMELADKQGLDSQFATEIASEPVQSPGSYTPWAMKRYGVTEKEADLDWDNHGKMARQYVKERDAYHAQKNNDQSTGNRDHQRTVNNGQLAQDYDLINNADVKLPSIDEASKAIDNHIVDMVKQIEAAGYKVERNEFIGEDGENYNDPFRLYDREGNEVPLTPKAEQLRKFMVQADKMLAYTSDEFFEIRNRVHTLSPEEIQYHAKMLRNILGLKNASKPEVASEKVSPAVEGVAGEVKGKAQDAKPIPHQTLNEVYSNRDAEINALETQFKAEEQRLSKEKTNAKMKKNSRKAAALDEEYRALKQAHESDMRSVRAKYADVIANHPEYIEQKRLSGEKAKALQAEREKSDAENQRKRDASDIEQIQSIGGFDVARNTYLQQIKDAQATINRGVKGFKLTEAQSHLDAAKARLLWLDELQQKHNANAQGNAENADRFISRSETYQMVSDKVPDKADRDAIMVSLEKSEKQARKNGTIQGGEFGWNYVSDVDNAIESHFAAKEEKQSSDKQNRALMKRAEELSQTPGPIRDLWNTMTGLKNQMDGVASERGLYGVKWAEKNVSSRWYHLSQQYRAAKERLLAAVRGTPEKVGNAENAQSRTVTHTDNYGNAADIPAAVVQEAAAVARQEGTPLKEQKKLLLANIDEAIKDAPENHADMATYNTLSDKLAAKQDVIVKFDKAASGIHDQIRRLTYRIEQYDTGHSEYNSKDKYESDKAQLLAEQTALADVLVQLRAARQEAKDVQAVIAEKFMVTIRVPDDGTFQVYNTKSALQAFKENASKMFPSAPESKSKEGYGKLPKPRGGELDTSLDGVDFNATSGAWHTDGKIIVQGKSGIALKPTNKKNDKWARWRTQSADEAQDSIDRVTPDDKVLSKVETITHYTNDPNYGEGISDRPLRNLSDNALTGYYVILQSGDNFTTIRGQYYNYVMKQHPKAEWAVNDNPQAPVVAKVDGKVVAIVMPMREQYEAVAKVQQYIGYKASEGAVSKGRSASDVANYPIEKGTENDSDLLRISSGTISDTSKTLPEHVIATVEREVRAGLDGQNVSKAISITRDTRSPLDSIASAFGKSLYFVEVQDHNAQSFGGLVVKSFPNAIFVDAHAENPHLQILGHELGHLLRIDHADLYKKLFDGAGFFREGLAKYQAEWQAKGRDFTIDGAGEEMVGNLIADNFLKKSFWNGIAKQEPSLFRKFADAVVNLVKQISKHFTNTSHEVTASYIKDYKRASNLVQQVMAEYAGRSAKQTARESSDVSRFSPAEQLKEKVKLERVGAALKANPTVQNATATLDQVNKGVASWFRPEALSDAAKQVATLFRAEMGRTSMSRENITGRMNKALEQLKGEQTWTAKKLDYIRRGGVTLADEYFSKRPEQKNYDFITKHMQGDTESMTNEEKVISKFIEEFNKAKQADLLATGTVDEGLFRENYFGLIYTKESRKAFNAALSEAITQDLGLEPGATKKQIEKAVKEAMEPSDPKNSDNARVPLANINLNEWSKEAKAAVKARAEELLAQGEGKDDAEIFSLLSKRPLEGSKGFMKGKVFDDLQSALDFGLKPISTNPLDIAVLKWNEMDKYTITHNMLAEAAKHDGAMGVIRAKPFEKAPEGWKSVLGKYGTVYETVVGEDGAPGKRVAYEYYMRPDVASVFNNYLSSTLYQRDASGLYGHYMNAANTLNMFQLGVGAFHGGFTTLESVISHGAIGIKALSRGDWKTGLKYLKETPQASYRNYQLGDKVMDALHSGDVQHSEFADVYKYLEAAGAKIGMDERFQVNAVQKAMEQWGNGKKVQAMASPRAFIETLSRPILSGLVPRQKLGVFTEMAREWSARNPNASHEAMRNEMQQIWNRVDSRLGQVVYDRLFVNNVAQNLTQAIIRAPGWTGGTLLEVGGGIIDLATWSKNLAQGKRGEMSDRAAYTLSLFITHALANALIGTAFGQPPQDWKDLLAFRTGNLDEKGRPERFMLPTYVKDVFHWGSDPVKTGVNKAHPLLSLGAEYYNNKDFYGTEIQHKDDNAFYRALQVGAHGAKAFTPFSIRGIQKEAERDSSVLGLVAPLVGVMPAPADYNKTDAEKLLTEYAADRMPQGARTEREMEKSKARQEIFNAIRKGDRTRSMEVFREARKKGLMQESDLHRIQVDAKHSPLYNSFNRIASLEQLENVWNSASDKEKAELKPVYTKKKEKLKYQSAYQ